MKVLLPLFALLSLSTASVSAQEKPTEEFLLELYEFCVDEYGTSTNNHDTEVLLCINEDLEYNNMMTFNSLADVKKALAAHLSS